MLIYFLKDRRFVTYNLVRTMQLRLLFVVTNDYWWALWTVFIVSGILWAAVISSGRYYLLRKIMMRRILMRCVLVSDGQLLSCAATCNISTAIHLKKLAVNVSR